MPDKVRVALLGCGGFSEARAQPALAECGLFKVAACYDPARAAALRAAGRWGARLCESAEEAVRADGVEAVAVMGPNDVHREQAEAAFAAGRHVFVEKPIANTAADGIAMVRAAERAGRVLMVGHHTRRLAPFRRVAEALASGRLGRPICAEAQFSHSGGKHLAADAWRADPARCPGLPLNVIGVHLVDVLNMLFGTPRRVAAIHRRAIVPTNDDCTATLVAYNPPVTATVMSHYCTPTVHELRVVGTEGVAEVHRGGTVYELRSDDGSAEREEHPEKLSLAEEFAVFVRAIRRGEPVETDGRAGVYAAAVTEASILSAREGRFVDIDEIVKGV